MDTKVTDILYHAHSLALAARQGQIPRPDFEAFFDSAVRERFVSIGLGLGMAPGAGLAGLHERRLRGCL